jgi:hypothetical protein
MSRVPTSSSVVGLAVWWRSATKAEKWQILKASIRGEAQAPELRALHVAIIVAETEAAGERLRGSEALHGQDSGDA